MAAIGLEGIHKTYPNGHVAVRGVDLTVADGEFLVLVGPSGCGKSTVLRLVAGLETPTRGRVLLGATDVTAQAPRERDVAMVFQSYALYPHKSVRENLAFGLRMRRLPAAEIEPRVAEVARVLDLQPVLERRPAQLSGGQRQRVALGRAMIREPKAFLFDEPLSNLDAKLRVETRAELARLRRRLGATVLYVTHDQEEAMTLGDRIGVMRDGQLEQVAAPLEVYRRPATVFVAGFVGSPAMNLLPGVLARESGGLSVRCRHFSVGLPAAVQAPSGSEVLLGVRPQEIEVAGVDQADATGRVDVVETLGSTALVHVDLGETTAEERIRLILSAGRCPAAGQPIGLRFRPECVHLFDRGTGVRLN